MLENEYGIHPTTSSLYKPRARDSQPVKSSSVMLEQDTCDTWDTPAISRKGYGDHDRNVTFEYAAFRFISTASN